MDYPRINVTELGEKIRSQEAFIVLDVREPYELSLVRIPDPRVESAPMSALSQRGLAALSEAARSGALPVYVMCHHGIRSTQVTAWLTQQGFGHIFNVSGGIDEYANRVDSSIGFY